MICGAATVLEHFPEKWMPVFRLKMRKIINLEPHFVSIKMRKALIDDTTRCPGLRTRFQSHFLPDPAPPRTGRVRNHSKKDL
jgi:hypothetical protein